jgi:hypothetical protein
LFFPSICSLNFALFVLFILVGVAKQRKAIVDGLRTSIVDFADTVQGSTTKEVMDLLLLTQYFDMIRDVGSAPHCRTTFVPSSHKGSDEIRNALLQAGPSTLPGTK